MNSEQTNEIAAALAKAQGAMTNAKYNKQMDMPGRKSYQYADLAAIIDAIRAPLADNGIGRSQSTQINQDGSFVLVTKLMHSSGQWIGSEHPLPLLPDKPQILGSALTYARRYALAALCGIAAEEDTDANGVAESAAEAVRQASKKPPPPKPDIIKPPPPKPDIIGIGGSGPPLHDPKTGEVMPDDIADATTEIEPNAAGIPIQDMAREAAERGREVMRQFYKSRSKAEKIEIDKIRPELDDLVDAANDRQGYVGEGS